MCCFLSGRHLPSPPFLYCYQVSETQPDSVYSCNPYPPPRHFHLLALLSFTARDYDLTCCKCDLSYLPPVSTRRARVSMGSVLFTLCKL